MHVPRSGSRSSLTLWILLLLALPWLLARIAGAEEPAHPSLQQHRERLQHIDRALRRADVRDAKRQVFKTQPWARADIRTVTGLDQAIEAPSRDAALERTKRFLEAAFADGERSFVLELDRLDAEGRETLARESGCGLAVAGGEGTEAVRECILRTYRESATALRDALMDDLRQADGMDVLRTRLTDLRDALRPSIKTRGRLRRKILTAPAFPAVWAWRKIHTANEYEGPQWIEYGDRYRLYAPEVALHTVPGTALSPDEEALLLQWAPLLVQEVTPPDASYPGETDRIGSFRLVAGESEPRPVVDPSAPASYAYATRVPVHGVELTQLVYTFWYPEHPKLKSFIDVEAGEIEGITLRITLDGQDQPRLYEAIYNCGCFHRVFVDRALEEAAAAELGPPEPTRAYSIQRQVDGRIGWVTPELVDPIPGRRPLLFVRAGFHLPASVRFELPQGFLDADGTPRETPETYAVHPYGELERLPWNGRPVGVFDDTGLVRGAGRLEGALLTPLGLYRGGQPRQRGTQLIHFDQADFDDPAIYDTYLRLPRSFFQGATSSPTRVAGRGTVGTGADSTDAKTDASGESR